MTRDKAVEKITELCKARFEEDRENRYIDEEWVKPFFKYDTYYPFEGDYYSYDTEEHVVKFWTNGGIE